MSNQDALYHQLRERFPHARADRLDNVYLECPSCGRSERDRKFSFSPRGANCFVCGFSGSLLALLKLLDIAPEDREYRPPLRVRTRPVQPKAWQKDPERILAAFLEHPQRIELWQAYRPLSLGAISALELGVGRLPSVACNHTRLTYPVRDEEGKIIGLRGRALDCDCPKWLSAAGSKAELLGKIVPDAPLWVCESPIDAWVMMEAHPECGAVGGTGGAGTWRDEWTERVLDATPSMVIVVYDNDLAGQARNEIRASLAREWREKHPRARRLPRANGPWLANKLRQAGIKATLFDWTDAPPKADVSYVLMTEGV